MFAGKQNKTCWFLSAVVSPSEKAGNAYSPPGHNNFVCSPPQDDCVPHLLSKHGESGPGLRVPPTPRVAPDFLSRC